MINKKAPQGCLGRRQRDSLSPAGSVRVGSACHRQPFTTDPFESFLMPNKKSTTRVLFVWRRQRDSNPRGVSPKRFSRPPRYDRFDMPPSKNIKLYLICNGFQDSCPSPSHSRLSALTRLLYHGKELLSRGKRQKSLS